MFAQLIEIRNQGDGDDGLAAGLDVQGPEVRAAGVHHAAIGHRSRSDIEYALMTLLLHVVALGVHGPNVHDAVAIGQKIDAAAPKHRIMRRAAPIRGQGSRFAAAVEGPDAFRFAAPIALAVARLLAPAREEQRVSIGGVDGVRSARQGHDLALAVAAEQHELRVGQR